MYLNLTCLFRPSTLGPWYLIHGSTRHICQMKPKGLVYYSYNNLECKLKQFFFLVFLLSRIKS